MIETIFKRRILILSMFLLTTISSLCQTESIINDEFRKLKSVMLPDSKVTLGIVETGSIKSLKDEQKVIFSLEEFEKLDNSKSSISKRNFVRLILAHELAHQMQFQRYKNELNYSESIFRMLLEAQADILAGYYYYYLLVKEKFDYILNEKGKPTNQSTEESYYVFTELLKLGITENSIGTHPSGNDRYMAFLSGGFMSSLELTIPFAKALSDKNIDNEQQKKVMKDLIESTMKASIKDLYDFELGQDNILDWSYREAKKVINFDPNITRNLVLISDQSKNTNNGVFWDSSRYVQYSFEYMNISSRHLQVEMDVYVSQPDKNTGYRLMLNKKNHSATLKPGEVMKVQGRLRWDTVEAMSSPDDDFVPFGRETARLNAPSFGNNSSRIACSFVNEDDDFKIKPEFIDFMNVMPSKESYNIAANFLELLRKYKYSLDDLYIGVGNYTYYDHPFLVPNVEYSCPFVFDQGATIRTVFLLPKSKFIYQPNLNANGVRLFVEYKDIASKQKALKKKEAIEKAVDFVLLNLNLKKRKSKPNTKWKRSNYRKSRPQGSGNVKYFGKEDLIDIGLRVHQDTDNKTWTITLSLDKIYLK